MCTVGAFFFSLFFKSYKPQCGKVAKMCKNDPPKILAQSVNLRSCGASVAFYFCEGIVAWRRIYIYIVEVLYVTTLHFIMPIHIEALSLLRCFSK